MARPPGAGGGRVGLMAGKPFFPLASMRPARTTLPLPRAPPPGPVQTSLTSEASSGPALHEHPRVAPSCLSPEEVSQLLTVLGDGPCPRSPGQSPRQEAGHLQGSRYPG